MKSRDSLLLVIPAQAGIHGLCFGVLTAERKSMDSRLRGNDEVEGRVP